VLRLTAGPTRRQRPFVYKKKEVSASGHKHDTEQATSADHHTRTTRPTTNANTAPLSFVCRKKAKHPFVATTLSTKNTRRVERG